MDERLRFVARLLDGEAMSEVCREFGVSRKTGYKIFDRTRSTASRHCRTARDGRFATTINCRRRSRASLSAASRASPIGAPAKFGSCWFAGWTATFACPPRAHAVLCRHGLVKIPGKPRRRANGTDLSPGTAPNDLWCVTSKASSSAAEAACASMCS
jgi:hypothetical protein